MTIVKVNLLEESHKNCDKISGYCQLYKIQTFHGVRPLPILGGDLKVLDSYKKGGAEKICYFRGDPKSTGESWPLRTPCIWKISHFLYDNLYDG